MSEVSVKVTLSPDKVPEVKYEGEWCRRDVDIAYRQMLKELLHHNKQLKEQRSKGEQNAK